MSTDLGAIFKAYDIRGIYPDELDEDVARHIGAALAAFTGAGKVAVGRDMRPSSPALAAAFMEGVNEAGANVMDLGQVSTDALYFASGRLDTPACMFTASHNPPRYNGLKLCKAQAVPVGSATGLDEIRDLAERGLAGAGKGGRGGGSDHGGARSKGAVESIDILADYSEHCRSFIDEGALRPLKVAIDAGNGMAGATAPRVFERLPFEVVPLFFELDGTFPNHPANPIEEANLEDLRRVVLERECDVGIAFDGDADRMFLVDEKAGIVSGSLTTAFVAEMLLQKNPGTKIIYNLICSWTVPEVIEENGGVPIRTRVGHSFIKDVMAKSGAIFGGEHSGHYYFRDNFRADSGMIAALIVLESLSYDERPLSERLQPFQRYVASGEINSEVSDQQAVLDELAAAYADGKQDHSDGLTVEFEDWWFNCRPSNTEPLLRLNLEARGRDLMETKRDEVLSLIRGEKS